MANLLKVTYTDAKTGKSRKSSKWYGQFRDEAGKVRRKPLSENKAVAAEMLRGLVNGVERAKAGFRDPHGEHRGVPLATHLEAYRGQFAAKGHTERQGVESCVRCRKAFEGCGWTLLADLDAEGLSTWLAGRRALPRTAGGFGRQTSNHYLAALKAFAAWCERTKRIPENPFRYLGKLNVATDLRCERREFAPHELAGLIEAAKVGPAMHGVAGRDRAALYLAASLTGLRSTELASLTRESFKLDAPQPVVVVEAGYSKRRRRDSVPLHPALVEELRPYLAPFPAGVRMWAGTRTKNYSAGEFVKRDLATARAAWIASARSKKVRTEREAGDDFKPVDAAGRHLDFHSLRHTFISSLVQAGVAPAVAMRLARHSTIALTIDRYTHVSERDAAAGLNKLAAPAAKIGSGKG